MVSSTQSRRLVPATSGRVHSRPPTSTRCSKPAGKRTSTTTPPAPPATGPATPPWRTRRSLERAATTATDQAAVSASHADDVEAANRPVSEQRETARVAYANATQRLDAHDRRAVELRDYASTTQLWTRRLPPGAPGPPATPSQTPTSTTPSARSPDTSAPSPKPEHSSPPSPPTTRH